MFPTIPTSIVRPWIRCPAANICLPGDGLSLEQGGLTLGRNCPNRARRLELRDDRDLERMKRGGDGKRRSRTGILTASVAFLSRKPARNISTGRWQTAKSPRMFICGAFTITRGHGMAAEIGHPAPAMAQAVVQRQAGNHGRKNTRPLSSGNRTQSVGTFTNCCGLRARRNRMVLACWLKMWPGTAARLVTREQN